LHYRDSLLTFHLYVKDCFFAEQEGKHAHNVVLGKRLIDSGKEGCIFDIAGYAEEKAH